MAQFAAEHIDNESCLRRMRGIHYKQANVDGTFIKVLEQNHGYPYSRV